MRGAPIWVWVRYPIFSTVRACKHSGMGYAITKLPHASKPWKVQFIDYRGNARKIRDLPETEYSRLGFRADMSIEDARKRKDQLNAQVKIKSVEAKRASIARRMDQDDVVLNAFLNADDVLQFETDTLLQGNDQDKKQIVWKAARRCLFDLKIEPQKWNYRKSAFYEWLRKQKFSPSYSQKIIMTINQWGEFQAMKYGFYFKALAFATGDQLYKISDAYYEKNPDGRASDPLTPEILESVRMAIKTEWFKWFFISLWFGLRPEEVDQLKKPQGKRTWMIVDAEGVDGKPVKCLQVYQKKLVKIPPEKRNKRIPIFLKEQREALGMILAGGFNRPSHQRHVAPYFKGRIYTYAGRKGFALLMRKYGQDQVNYSRWLGHTTTDRTEQDYEQKQVVEFRKVPLRRVK